MQGSAGAKGSALRQAGGTLSGSAIVDGEYMGNKSVSGGVTVGPILMGTAGAAHILTPAATVRRVLNMTAVAAAQKR